jgi:hypothetical protein
VVLSYWLDTHLYRAAIARGLMLTNTLIYAACCLLAAYILTRWIANAWPAALAALFFAAHAAHSEVIWYVAGRTDSLGVLAFLVGLALHLAGDGRRWALRLAPVAYAAACLTKELTVGLPVVCLLHDWLIGPARGPLARVLALRWRLYGGYALGLLVALTLRTLALGGDSGTLVYPYFVSPLRADFPQHLWVQLRIYAESLLIAQHVPALEPAAMTARFLTRAGLIASLLAIAAAIPLLRRDRRSIVLVSLGVLTWLPTTVVYLSERYVLLPSFALAGLLGLALTHLRPRVKWFAAGVALALAWTGYHGYWLFEKNRLATQPAPTVVTDALLRAREQVPRGATVIAVNLPGDWLDAQFAEAQFRWALGDTALRVHVLNTVPMHRLDDPACEWVATGERTLVLRSPNQPRANAVADNRDHLFETALLAPGLVVRSPALGFEVAVVRGNGPVCGEACFTFPRPLSEYLILDMQSAP